MAEINVDTVVYDGKSFKPDEDGNATTEQGKRMEALGFTQRLVAHPRYDEELVLDHSRLGRVSPGQVAIVHEGEAVAIVNAPPEVPVAPDESWSKADLLTLAAERDVTGRSDMTKAELVAALT